MKWTTSFGMSVLLASAAWSPGALRGEGRSNRARTDVVLVARDADGGETWRARTEIRDGGSPSIVDEQVVLGPNGQLLHGFVQVAPARGAVVRRWYEPTIATVIVEEGGATARLATPNDVPWIYETIGPSGTPVVTPLGTWATYRAAANAPVVRVVGPASSRRVPSDQLLVATERGPVVVNGIVALELDPRFGATARDVTSSTPGDLTSRRDSL
jgi:hypothetical protein